MPIEVERDKHFRNRPYPTQTSDLAEAQFALGSPERNEGQGLLRSLMNVRFTLLLFVLALLIPTYTSFAVGPFRLTVYRFFLLVAFVPSAVRVFSQVNSNRSTADRLIAGGALWAAMTLVYHEGANQGLEAGGIFVLETLGAYLLGRVLVPDEKSYRSFVAIIVVVVSVLLVFTFPESLSGKNLFGQPPNGMEPRLGLNRAQGPFDHPIIHGVFCAGAFSMSWCAFSNRSGLAGATRILRSLLISAAAITSVSSGAITALFVQWFFLVWIRLTQSLRRRWQLFSTIFALLYVSIDMLSNRGPMRVFFSYLTLSPGTAYGRMIIWEWGFHQNALKHPFVGIGLGEWVRPSWMISGSMDNFWLVLMVRHGLPCFLLFAWAIFLLMRAGSKGAREKCVTLLYTGWAISLVGLIVSACTVHFWNALLTYFFFFLGAGAWFHKSQSTAVKS